MEVNPYSPPQAKVADPPPTSHGLKRRSVLVMVLFMIITLGLYYPVWWFRRRPGLNRLNSPKKLAAWPLLLLAALWVIQFGLGLVQGLRPGEEVIGAGGRLFASVFQLAVDRDDHSGFQGQRHDRRSRGTGGAVRADVRRPVQLSGLMTFFFSIFYLQWAINRYVVGTPS
jgi:hypothetical protein